MPESKQLELLMKYTLFHIGIYITAATAAIALPRFAEELEGSLSLKISLVCFVLAGACGGVIASQIPNFATWELFKEKKLGPWRSELMVYEGWARAEHALFWVAALAPVVGFGFLC